MHLPFFAAAADGLFAEHGLSVELLESAPGPDVYTSSVLAADAVPDDLVERFGYPQVDPDDAVESWLRLAPYAGDGGDIATMGRTTWERTIAWMARTHHLPVIPVENVARVSGADMVRLPEAGKKEPPQQEPARRPRPG